MAKTNSKLGLNIKILRKAHGETQQELGRVISVEDNTISMYESGKRQPDLQTLQAISFHYGCSVDQLIRSDMLSFDYSNIVFSWENVVSMIEIIFPIASSAKALGDPLFVKGYGYINKIMEEVKKGGEITRSIFERALEVYFKSLEESETLESAANILWLIYVLYCMIPDEHSEKMGKAILYGNPTRAEFIKNFVLKNENNTDDESELNKKLYTREMNESIVVCLQLLKDSTEYTNLADYYLSLRYIIGMVDTDYGQDLNRTIGIEMMMSFLSLGNHYAFKFIEKFLKF